MMKKNAFLFFVLLFAVMFSQEKITTNDFGLHPNTETVVSTQTWANADYNKGVYIETLTFYNTYLQSKKSQDGEYITTDKYFYDIDNQLVKIETLHENSGETEMLKFNYQNGKLITKEFYLNDKLITKTVFSYDKNGKLINETEKSLEGELVSVANYNNYVNDNTYTKSSVDYKDNKFLEKRLESYVNGLLISEDNEMYNLKSNVKYIYSTNRRLVKEIINNDEMNVYSYKLDENGNPIKIFKMNNYDKGDSIIMIQNTYSDFKN